MLEPEQQFRALFLGNVLGGAPVAPEPSPAVEHRLGAGADVAYLAPSARVGEQKIKKRLPRLQHRLVGVPASAVRQGNLGPIPAGFSETRLGIESRFLELSALDHREAVVLILL